MRDCETSQRDTGRTAYGSAKTPDQLNEVFRNTFVQGTLSVIFASVVVIVIVAAIIMAYKLIRDHGEPLTEDEPVPSRMLAPSGMIPSAAERELQKQWDTLHAESTAVT